MVVQPKPSQRCVWVGVKLCQLAALTCVNYELREKSRQLAHAEALARPWHFLQQLRRHWNCCCHSLRFLDLCICRVCPCATLHQILIQASSVWSAETEVSSASTFSAFHSSLFDVSSLRLESELCTVSLKFEKLFAPSSVVALLEVSSKQKEMSWLSPGSFCSWTPRTRL